MLDLVITSSIAHSLLLVLPLLAAWLMRRAGCPGAAIVGGVIAGVLLGPTVLGRVTPAMFEQCFVGGGTERETLADLRHANAREADVARAAGLDDEAIAAMTARHEEERRVAQDAWTGAQWKFQRPLRSYTAAMVTLALLGAGLRRAARDPAAPGGGWVATSSIGLWAAALPGALAFTAATRWFGAAPAAAAVVGAAVAIGPWTLSRDDRAAADRAERGGARTVALAGRLASLVALVTIAAAVARKPGAAWMLPLAALPLGWTLPAVGEHRVLRALLDGAVVPSLAACAALRIEVISHFAIGPLVVLILLSGDGRWLGAFLGAMLSGSRAAMRTMRLVVGSMACGPTQLAVVALAAHAGLVPPALAYGLLAGVLLVETTAPARRVFVERAEQAEDDRGPDRAD